MLATEATGTKEGGQPLLGALHVTAARNYFGAQVASFEGDLELGPALAGRPDMAPGTPGCRGVFIRAPALTALAPSVTPLAWVVAAPGDVHAPAGVGSGPAAAASPPSKRVVVAAQEGRVLATAFHPELGASNAWHAYFVEAIVAPSLAPSVGATAGSATAAPAASSAGAAAGVAGPSPATATAPACPTPGTSPASSWLSA